MLRAQRSSAYTTPTPALARRIPSSNQVSPLAWLPDRSRTGSTVLFSRINILADNGCGYHTDAE